MKCYTLTYDTSKRAPKVVYVSKNSAFQVGIKVNNSTEVQLRKEDGTEISSSGILADFTTFAFTSGAEEAVDKYFAYAPDADALFPLTIITTKSDVAELDALSPADVSTATLSGTYEDGTEFSINVLTK